MSAPENVWIDWYPEDDGEMPISVSAHTVRSSYNINRQRVKYIRLDAHEAALVAAKAEADELRSELGAFLAVWAVTYARQCQFAQGELHPQHYDRMAELGLRMADFRRAAIPGDAP